MQGDKRVLYYFFGYRNVIDQQRGDPGQRTVVRMVENGYCFLGIPSLPVVTAATHRYWGRRWRYPGGHSRRAWDTGRWRGGIQAGPAPPMPSA
jgi:hypothetical protein